jgi:hypothetical protein
MATVSTTPRHHFYQNNGALAAGGTLEIFDANTVTHAITWNDRDGATIHQNANPLTLDSQGAAIVWLEAGKVYDWIAKDALGNTIDSSKGIIGSTSAIAAVSQWVVTALTPTFVNTRTFTLVGDQTATYEVGRRVRVTLTGGFKYATIISSVFSTLTTVTLGFANNTDVLDSSISAVDVGLDLASSPSDIIGAGSIIDLTGYSGADVPLKIGQSAIYTVTAATTLLLRIATANNQIYEIHGNFNGQTLNQAAPAKINPNNSTPASVLTQYFISNQATPTGSVATQAFIPIGNNNALTYVFMTATTATTAKTVDVRRYFGSDLAANRLGGGISNIWLDTTTAWTSLGTLDFVNSLTGLVKVTRTL